MERRELALDHLHWGRRRQSAPRGILVGLLLLDHAGRILGLFDGLHHVIHSEFVVEQLKYREHADHSLERHREVGSTQRDTLARAGHEAELVVQPFVDVWALGEFHPHVAERFGFVGVALVSSLHRLEVRVDQVFQSVLHFHFSANVFFEPIWVWIDNGDVRVGDVFVCFPWLLVEGANDEELYEVSVEQRPVCHVDVDHHLIVDV